MIIELHINGEPVYQWEREDIREDYTDLGIYRYNQRLAIVLDDIENDLCRNHWRVWELIQLGYGEFAVVFQSNLNNLHYTDAELKKDYQPKIKK